MRYACKLCNGKGKQKNSLTCTCCRGIGFFDLTGKVVEECRSCKGSGRGVIKTLPCIRCNGKGFSVLSEAAEKSLPEQREEEKETRLVEEEIAPEERPAEAPLEQEVAETESSVYQEKLPETQTLLKKEPEIETPVRVEEEILPEEGPKEETIESFKEPEMSKSLCPSDTSPEVSKTSRSDKRKARRARRKKKMPEK